MRRSMRYWLAVFLIAAIGQANSAFAGNEMKVALVMKALSNPFFLKMQEGAKAYADKKGIELEAFGIERETDVDRQIGIMENLIARGYGAIVIAPADSKTLVPVCKKAVEKGIVVINIDNPLHKETLQANQLSIPFVGSDNRAGAAMVGSYLKRKLNGAGKVMVIEGIRGAENAELRKDGFIEAVTAESQIEIVAAESANWHTDEAFAVTTALLEAHPDASAIFCANDSMALGAIQALDMAGLSTAVLVGGYDNIEEVRAAMSSRAMHATIEQHPELMGEYGVDLAARAMRGERIPAYTSTPLDVITSDGFEKKIGLSLSNTDNPFFADLRRGAERAADLFGAELLVKNAGNDDAQQLVDLQAFLDEPVALIIVNPTNAETVSPAIELANSAGIPVMTVDRAATNDAQILAHVDSDNVAGGKMAAEFVANSLNGKGSALELEGIPGTSAAHDRGQGFDDALKAFPDLKIAAREVADFDRQKARDVVEHLLKGGLRVDAVFAHNDAMILGAIDAFEAAQKPLPAVLVGFDAIPDALAAIREKKLTATVAQKPENMGWQAVKSAVAALQGETLPPKIFVDLELISQ